MIPRIVVGVGLIVGLFGIGGYLKSGNSAPETHLVRQPRKLAEQAMPIAQAATKKIPAFETNAANKIVPAISETQNLAALNRPQTQIQAPPKPSKPQIETTAEVYFCGAETKKGTPCKRRVKENIRCYQHVGMPVMLQPDKLRIN